MTAVSNMSFTETVSGALRREFGADYGAVKRVAEAAQSNIRSTKNWLLGTNAPSGASLVMLMAESDAVFEAVMQLSGRARAADGDERAAALAKLDELRRTLERLP